MRTRAALPIVVVGIALFLGTGSVWAHHAVVAEFDLSKPITMRGTLTKLEWTNPHGWIHMDVKGADGKVENWAFETGSPGRMQKRGLKKSDFRPGMELIIGGFPAKAVTRTAVGWIVTFPDREASYPAREASFPLGR